MTERHFTDVQIEELAEHLRGTPQTLAHGVEFCFEDRTDDDMTVADCEALDAEIFCCAKCEWWCNIDEMAEGTDDDPVCEDCEG